MKMTKKMKNYIPLVPPLAKPFEEFSDDEVEQYFEWFTEHVDERAEYLREKVATEMCVDINKLDYSAESVKIIWKWFLGVAEIEKPNLLRKMFTGKTYNAYPFDVFTHYVIRDIGMYISKIFLKYPSIHWTVKTKPKNYVSVNRPLLVGFVDDNPEYPKPFHPDLEPISFVEGCVVNILYGDQNENDLYNYCVKWLDWVLGKAL